VQARAEVDYVARVKAGKQGDPEEGGQLGRLPSGRHGLTREFVVRNQRDRLTAGMIQAVAEKGYHDATVSQISEAAGVSRRTFYTYFSSKEDCFFDTYQIIADRLRELARDAASEESDWPSQARVRVATTLEFFASNPDLARFCLIVPSRAGDKIAARFQQAVKEVYDELAAGMPATVADRAPSPAVQQSLIGGMAALVMEKVEAGEGERLTDLLPDLLEIFFTPYLGREEAVKVARQGS
jgi:AcrR family transcriptional regulator